MRRFELILATLLLVASVLLLLGLSGEGAAKTITVDDDGGADYEKIQDAVDAAEDGDTIRIWAGNYSGAEITKALSLVGNGTTQTMTKPGFVVRKSNSSVEELCIHGAATAVFFNSSVDNVTIRNCSMINNDVAFFCSSNNENVRIENCTISECGLQGFSSFRLTESRIIRCSFENSGEHGVELREGSSNQIKDCTFTSNRFGIFLDGPRKTLVNNCSFERNEIGIFDDGIETEMDSNQFHNNTVNLRKTEKNEDTPGFESSLLPTVFLFAAVLIVFSRKH